MKIKYKKIHIGRRTIKTAVAVILSIMAVSLYGVSASKMTFAMLGAMSAMENTFKRAWENCMTQIVGMICGAAVGLLLLQFPMHWLLCVGIGIVFIITIYNVFSISFPPGLPCLILLTVCTTSDMHPFAYAIERLWDTAIGLGIGMLINVLVLPYDNSLKIKNSIEYLKGEVIAFLEDMFDGDTHYPDTDKMAKTIKEMAGQLGILSEQWIPLRQKRNQHRLVILRECEGKARQLLSHMEVLSQMKTVGALSDTNAKKLKECGANVYQGTNADVEADMVTNYHVEQILKLREALMEDLMQFPVQHRITKRMSIFENGQKSVYTGMSVEFGPVVLKQDQNIAQIKFEYRMLAKLHGNHSCKVYAFHEQKGELLEERILPGTKLREEESLSKRLDAFESVFGAIHIPAEAFEQEDFETYLDWLFRAKAYCEKSLPQGDVWTVRAQRAYEIAKELFEKYPDRVLLHGDLHHDNLLLRGADDYVIVDPKGVIGPAIFDLPRFIINEREVEAAIVSLSARLGYEEKDVRKLVYMEAVLANVWNLEDGMDIDKNLEKLVKE